MKAVWLFPGQGAQQAGMGEALFARFPRLVALADDILGLSVREFCQDPSRLSQTRFTQPALFVVGALWSLAELLDARRRPAMAAGMSLGEYIALFAAGALDFSTGLALVQRRAAAMAACDGGSMAAVVGHPVPDATQLARWKVSLAVLSSPTRWTLSGPPSAVAAASDALTQAGAVVVPLSVSGAFHSPAMQPAAAALSAALQAAPIAAPIFPVYSNVTGEPMHTPEEIRRLLSAQLTGTVRWHDCLQAIHAAGGTRFSAPPQGRSLLRQARAVRSEGRHGRA